MKRCLLPIVALLIVAGCLNSGTATSSGGASISGVHFLPVAQSGQSYQATITPAGGASPYTCELMNSTIAGNLGLSDACVIEGSAPTVAETTIYPFTVKITEANGEWRIFDMTLTVEAGNPFVYQAPQKVKDGTQGKKYKDYFCEPVGQMNCGKNTNQANPAGGNPPYSFTVSGQPMGLIMKLNGILEGTIPENARPGNYPMTVCARDLSGAQGCGQTTLYVKEAEATPTPTATATATATPTATATATPEPEKTEWKIRVMGNGPYNEYDLMYGFGGEFTITASGNKLEGSGFGHAAVDHKSGDCSGEAEFEVEGYDVEGTITQNQATVTLYNSDPPDYMLQYHCSSLNYDVGFDAKSPYDFEGVYVTFSLEQGVETKKTVKIPGEHARTLEWTFTVV
ncbi:putative Ig domain-containing protein [archaeon]